MSKIHLIFIAISIALVSCNNINKAKEANQSSVYNDIEFEMEIVKEPIIPSNVVSIVDFGAIEGGQTINTEAFAQAIKAVSEKGGGTVVIPAGTWLTGPIILKSNLELRAESGALIKFSTNKDLYPLIETSFEGLNTWRCLSPIYGKNVEDVAFTGSGIWDGSGEVWRMVKKSKLTDSQWNKLIGSGGIVSPDNRNWFPSEQYMEALKNSSLNVPMNLTTKEEYEAIRDFLRPVMVSIQNSKRVMFDGPVFQNSPAWNIHPLVVEDLIVRNLTVRNPWFSQNGDGIDIESCKNVIVEHSNFDVGDDAICIKSGKDEDGRLRGVPCENLIIKNNIVYHGHGGVTVGSEMSSGVKNMHVSNCTFIGTDVGLRFKSRRGRGGVVENIYISDIRMTDIKTNAISFNLYYGGKSVSEMLADGGAKTSSEEVPVTEETPQFKNISISNISILGAYQAIFLQGLPEMNLENVEISNVLAKAKAGITMIDANNVKIENIDLNVENRNAIHIFNSKNVNINKTVFNSNAHDAIIIGGSVCKNIEVNSTEQTPLANHTTIQESVSENAVTIK